MQGGRVGKRNEEIKSQVSVGRCETGSPRNRRPVETSIQKQIQNVDIFHWISDWKKFGLERARRPLILIYFVEIFNIPKGVHRGPTYPDHEARTMLEKPNQREEKRTKEKKRPRGLRCLRANHRRICPTCVCVSRVCVCVIKVRTHKVNFQVEVTCVSVKVDFGRDQG